MHRDQLPEHQGIQEGCRRIRGLHP